MTAGAYSDLREEYAAWLADFLPADYYDRYAEYRWDLDLRKRYQEASFEAGWLQPTWSREHGGRDLDEQAATLIRLEAALRSAPKLPNIQGPNVAAPGIRQFGTPEQIDRLLVPCLRGTEWWALGMSEPEAGSDFGSLRTRAERDGEDYVVNGQKIWTTHGRLSRWATLYVRTDPSVPKHQGITCLLLDMQAEGVTTRPIRMATVSDEEFCEVFLDDVRVPVSMRLGDEGQGWKIAMASLGHERAMIWVMNWVELHRGLREVRRGVGPDPTSRSDLAADLGRRLADATALREIGMTQPESLILKLLGSEALQQTWELAALAAGPQALTDPELTFERHDALAATLYGGTSEVQRNIIGERVLGLPKA